MKKPLIIALIMTISPITFAAEINTNKQQIIGIKTNWANDGNTSVYYYKVNNDNKYCDWIRSGDKNINDLAIKAYEIKKEVSLGINDCVITTLEVGDINR